MFEIKLAPCPLLAAANGVVLTTEHLEVLCLRGHGIYCDKPWDCHECPLFCDWADSLTGGDPDQVVWACFQCLERVRGGLLGFYSSGPCSFCGREAILLNAAMRSA